MTDSNYLKAIGDAQRLLTELLDDPEHGKLTFKGTRGLDDLIVTGPKGLDDVTAGGVVVIGDAEWMALSYNVCEPRQWQHYSGGQRATGEELYLLALKNADDLHYAHTGDCSDTDL